MYNVKRENNGRLLITSQRIIDSDLRFRSIPMDISTLTVPPEKIYLCYNIPVGGILMHKQALIPPKTSKK